MMGFFLLIDSGLKQSPMVGEFMNSKREFIDWNMVLNKIFKI